MSQKEPELWQVIDLLQVTLVSAKVDNRFLSEALTDEPPKLALDWSAEACDLDEHSMIVVNTWFSVQASRGASEVEEPLMRVEARYQIHYMRPPDFSPSEEQLEEFATRNGVFNAWPYWRELSHSLYGKMNLPFPPMPVFRVGMLPPGAAALDSSD